MKQLPVALAAHLAGGATTLAWCWRLTRRDGVRLGFTDHDRDLSFDGTVFEAASGFSGSEMRESIGLSVDDLEIDGALVSGRLSETDLAAGLFDDARVEIFRVNWQEPAQRVLMRKGSIGEVRRSGASFSAEVRGLSHYLQQPKGRLFQYTCDADLGDARCGVSLPAFTVGGTVIAVDSTSRVRVIGIVGVAAGVLARGLFSVTSGPAAGFRVEVRADTRSGLEVVLDLWQPVPETLAPGAFVTVSAGCDKTLETCRGRFANAANFRGFPHMPGNDFVVSYARAGAAPRSSS